jgi:hypothetical protein
MNQGLIVSLFPTVVGFIVVVFECLLPTEIILAVCVFGRFEMGDACLSNFWAEKTGKIV